MKEEPPVNSAMVIERLCSPAHVAGIEGKRGIYFKLELLFIGR